MPKGMSSPELAKKGIPVSGEKKKKQKQPLPSDPKKMLKKSGA